jgi:predicted Zn-dependent protease
MRRRCSSGIAAALVAILLIGCAPLSYQDEAHLGQQVNAQIKDEADLVRDRRIWDYVRRIGHKVVVASGPQPFTYHFYVVESDSINAFALPAGYIYVNTETIVRAKNVSELAGVMGHEVGHVVKRHVAHNYRRQQNVGALHRIGAYTAALIGGGLAGSAADLGGGLAAAAYLNSYGRDAEREADVFAVEVLPKAGYDPDGLVTFFETMMQEAGGGPPAWLSSHPTTSERIEKIRALIREADLPDGLRKTDGGRLQKIQRRIRELRKRRR